MKGIFVSLIIFATEGIVDSQEKNVDSIFLMTKQLIEANGYSFESHWVQTPDNYRLNIHRIPPGKTDKNNNRVAFLQHGILSLSTAWVLLGNRRSLAFMLADEGYDVWMGNFRGNVFSRNHTTLDPNIDSTFWQFTWDEMGVIDLPTMIDYVLGQTEAKKIYFVGHSQGSTAFYVMASEKPENNKINVEISLAPIAFLGHLTSPILRTMSRFGETIKLLLDMTGVGEFLPETGIVGNMVEQLCKRNVTINICDNIMFSILGSSPDYIEHNTTALMMQCHPAGSSTKQIMHFVQEIQSGYFRKYDYGSYKNLKTYGTQVPPSYQLDNVTVPVFLFYSDNDLISAIEDIDKLCTKLKNCSGKLLLQKFGHLDYMFGKNAPASVNKKVINIFNRY